MANLNYFATWSGRSHNPLCRILKNSIYYSVFAQLPIITTAFHVITQMTSPRWFWLMMDNCKKARIPNQTCTANLQAGLWKVELQKWWEWDKVNVQ